MVTAQNQLDAESASYGAASLRGFTIAYEDGERRAYSETFTYSLGEVGSWLGGSPPVGPTQSQMDEGRRHHELVEALEKIAFSRSNRT